MEKKPKIDDGELGGSGSGAIKLDLAKILDEKLGPRSTERGSTIPPLSERIPRFRGDYANAYSAPLMYLNMGKDLGYEKLKFPIESVKDYSIRKIKQEIAAENTVKPEEITQEIERRLHEEVQTISESDQRDIEEVDRLVEEVNGEYQEALNNLSANPDASKQVKDGMRNSIINKLKMIDGVVKRKK